MKKIIKNNLLGFIVGAVIFSGITVLATQYLASDISFTPKDTTWKKSNGENITNVKEAIDELYTKSNNSIISTNYFNTNYYQGRIASMNASNNLNKGKYLCSAIFSLSSTGSAGQYYTEDDSDLTISGCNKLDEKKEYLGNIASNQKDGNLYHLNQIRYNSFTCDINEDNVTVTATYSTNSAAITPAQILLNCTLIN